MYCISVFIFSCSPNANDSKSRHSGAHSSVIINSVND